jgi:hypothetical protein
MTTLFKNTFLLILLSTPILAQNIVFKATLSDNQVSLDNQFQISFSVENVSGIQNFRPPNLDAFYVLSGPNRSSSFSNINGSSSSKISFSYILQAKKIGSFKINGATAFIEGKNIISNVTEINVIKLDNKTMRYHNKPPQNNPINDPQNPFSSNPNSRRNNKNKIRNQRDLLSNINKKVFAQLDVDKTETYVGEQLIASYNVYTQIPCNIDVKKITTPEGFWTHDFTDVINPHECEKVIINGQAFRKYTLRKTALFATKSGKLYIPPMTFEGYAQIETETESNSAGNIIEELFGEVFEGGAVTNIPLNLSTDSLVITAKELPIEKKSLDFNNNVGNYSLENNINKTELSTNDVATLSIIIRGKGNIRLINNPIIRKTDSFEILEPSIFDTITNNKNDVEGYKIFKYTIQPKQAGVLNIPRMDFHYYDPESKSYKTLQSSEYTLNVTEAVSLQTKEKKSKPQVFHDIANEDNMQKKITLNQLENPVYWLAYLLPLSMLGGILFYKKRKNKKVLDSQHIALHKKHNTLATDRMSIALELLKKENKSSFYNQTAQALWLYLSDKLNIPMSELNIQSAKKIMQDKNIESSLQIEFLEITKQCQEALYAQQDTTNAQQVYARALAIISKLENHLQ